jgi:hypothetical protein
MNKHKRLIYKALKNLKFLPKHQFFKIRYGAYTGKKLDLNNPVEFNAKIHWLKMYYHPPILTQLADKYAVRAYVTEKIGAQYLNDLHGFYTQVDSIDFESLPNQFVMKAVHGSSTNLIVKDKSHLNLEKTRKTLHSWMRHNQYQKVGFEWAYKHIKPGIIIEKYLAEDDKNCLTDYKFACFNGKVKYVQVILDNGDKVVQIFLDTEFNILEFNRVNRESYEGKLQKPIEFDTMLHLAETLADKLPYVRVDFYLVNHRIIFGEMTFYPGDGKHDFYPDYFNKTIGDYMKLPLLEKGQKEITNY